MGITGLIPFVEKASRRANVSEFSGCTVAIDSYCWLHKGAFACAEKLVRGENTDVHIKYCLKYVTMLLSKNIKPILVFDGRHLPAKALTEIKRRESRDISKKRAAELLSLGKIEEARSYLRRSIDITHTMALELIKECRKRNVDCIVAPYEADAQLAYLNIKNYAHLVITEDSDLILFGCTKVLFKMDLDGFGTLVETVKLPLVMKCPIEQYNFDKFRQMCIMSGCDYLPSLPGIGLARARQFVVTTQDPNFANALRKLPSFLNRANLTVTDEYRENFLKAEATFKHQYVYDPMERCMVRLTDPDDEDLEEALCVNAGELLDGKIAFELALGNLDPFSLKKMDSWHPEERNDVKSTDKIKSGSWADKPANHPSIWSKEFENHLSDPCPWQKKVQKKPSMFAEMKTRVREKKVVNLVARYVPETQDESLSIATLSSMYCMEPVSKKQKTTCDNENPNETDIKHNIGLNEDEIKTELSQPSNRTSPILENKDRSFKKSCKNGTYSVLKRLSRFPRTVLNENIVESKFFSTASSLDSNCDKNVSRESVVIEESPEKISKNPFKVKTLDEAHRSTELEIECTEDVLESSQKENSELNSPEKLESSLEKLENSPVLVPSPRFKNPLRRLDEESPVGVNTLSQDSGIDTYIMESFEPSLASQPLEDNISAQTTSQPISRTNRNLNGFARSTCRVPGLKRTASLPSNQPTLLSKFGFQRKPALKR